MFTSPIFTISSIVSLLLMILTIVMQTLEFSAYS